MCLKIAVQNAGSAYLKIFLNFLEAFDEKQFKKKPPRNFLHDEF
jgi:hypothetical protein